MLISFVTALCGEQRNAGYGFSHLPRLLAWSLEADFFSWYCSEKDQVKLHYFAQIISVLFYIIIHPNLSLFFLSFLLQWWFKQLALPCISSWWRTSVSWKWAFPGSATPLRGNTWRWTGCRGPYYWVCYIYATVWKEIGASFAWRFPWWTHWRVHPCKLSHLQT